jgi:hypothetical protein
MDNFKELTHIMMTIDIPKEIEEEQTGRIITGGTEE